MKNMKSRQHIQQLVPMSALSISPHKSGEESEKTFQHRLIMTVLTIYSKRDLWKVRDRNIAEIFVPGRQNIRIESVAKMCLCESKGAFYVLSEESLTRGQIYQDAVLHCEN